MQSVSFTIKGAEQTVKLGTLLSALCVPLCKKLQRSILINLEGDLGAGKTTFTKGIGQALGIERVINSPTFTILKIYEGKIPLYHIDAYRLDGNPYDLGISEYEDEGIMVIEWPECYKDFLPDEYLEISFNYIDDNTREIEFKAYGKKYEKILEVLNA